MRLYTAERRRIVTQLSAAEQQSLLQTLYYRTWTLERGTEYHTARRVPRIEDISSIAVVFLETTPLRRRRLLEQHITDCYGHCVRTHWQSNYTTLIVEFAHYAKQY